MAGDELGHGLHYARGRGSRHDSGGRTDREGGAHAVEHREGGEHLVGVDPEVDEAGELVDPQGREAATLALDVLGRADQPACLAVAVNGRVEQLLELLRCEGREQVVGVAVGTREGREGRRHVLEQAHRRP